MQPGAKQKDPEHGERRRSAARHHHDRPPRQNWHLRRKQVVDYAAQRLGFAVRPGKALHDGNIAKRVRGAAGERGVVVLHRRLQSVRAPKNIGGDDVKNRHHHDQQAGEPPIVEQRRWQEQKQCEERGAILTEKRQPQPEHGPRAFEHRLQQAA